MASPPPAAEARFLGMRLSRLNQRRLANFRRNRRGFWSNRVFWFLFALSLPAEFIANDRPLLVRFDGSFYFPVLATYPETAFGGDFETEAEYRDPFVSGLIEEKGWILWPPIPFSYDTVNYGLEQPAPSPPGGGNLARHRRPGPRRRRAADLRVPHLGAVRPPADPVQRPPPASPPGRCRGTSAAGST